MAPHAVEFLADSELEFAQAVLQLVGVSQWRLDLGYVDERDYESVPRHVEEKIKKAYHNDGIAHFWVGKYLDREVGYVYFVLGRTLQPQGGLGFVDLSGTFSPPTHSVLQFAEMQAERRSKGLWSRVRHSQAIARLRKALRAFALSSHHKTLVANPP